jgi:uncharacterized damage-inducible protein DinB
MALPYVFDSSTTKLTLERLEKLTSNTQAQWGKMDAGQMLAHLNVSYDLAFGKIQVNDNFFVKFMLKLFVKNAVVSEKPYPKNSQTASYFLQKGPKDFETEKSNFIENVKAVEQKGESFFDGKDSVSFGKLTKKEWSNLFYKHIDHHFGQFGV